MSRTMSSSSGYPYHQDAIRIQAQIPAGDESGSNQLRRFSVDPSLTDFSILKNLIGRAFDLKGDFVINYRALDDYGGEIYLPLVSDWDLGAAFLSASSTIPDLQLMIEPRHVPLDGSEDYTEEPSWELIKSAEVIKPSPLPIANHHRRTQGNGSSRNPNTGVNNNKTSLQSANFNPKINTAGIFNTMERWVQKALTFVEDISVVTTRPPLSDVEFRNYLDPAGILLYPRELRFACFHGGVESSLRRVVWKHLLNVYPDGLTGSGRIEYIRNKSKDYYELRDSWKSAIQKGVVNEELLCVSNMVKKDVLRTDRHLKFFSGHDDNQNIANLFDILTTYALNHPSVSYCQGMSDLASPLLVTMGDEAQAYICFCSLMERLNPNFNSDGLAMSLKFAHLSEALAHCDSEFWTYLKTVGADDLLFCYRWLLLEMKREFVFEDALRMMEVLWSSLPYKPQDVSLYEVKYTGSSTQSVPIPVPSLTSSYSKVCAIRRSSTTVTPNDLRNRRYSRNKQKASPHLSLDENSLSSVSSTVSSGMGSGGSRRKPFYSLDDTMEVLSCSDFPPSTSPFEILNFGNLENLSLNSSKPKLIKNLREFWQIGRKGSKSSKKSNSSPGGGDSNPSSGDSTLSESEGSTNACSRDDASNSVFRDSETTSKFVFPPAAQPEASNNGVIGTESSSPVNPTLTGILEGGLKTDSHSPVINGLLTTDNPKTQNNDGVCSDSENDSGHCCESLELENSLEEPGFQSGGLTTDSSNPAVMKLPGPEEFGGGNPFLMFLCLTMLLQHRDHIIRNRMDYNETAMYFDKMVRKHNVVRVLAHARQMYGNYLKQTLIPKA